ncbi:hypothetical protein OG689_11015 [Kitasatospora sp. NBC_00240]|uniref:hypothetical protein n=1 Tax=Kitasatospora sp. NBC_00240 TaxID=2903567 RepID=UPI002252BDFA|nr:hypothetical protein [Kitasatospora sp. NBC_00240]MCX5209815.1 hypothetical protein [Kitasatospora sp. NBC_00240]
MPNRPYVSTAAFKAHPTYLDLDGLRSGSSSSDEQDAELTNILLMASQWADNEIDMPLGAHSWTQRCRSRVDRQGNLRFHAEHSPVLSVGAVGYGYSPTTLTTAAGPPAWVEDGANLVVALSASGGAWSGSLQFGAPTSAGEVFVQAQYAAGRVATILSQPALAGATTLTVEDPTGILPGESYRIWEPGVEETITIADTWTPTTPGTAPAPTAVPLANPALFVHTAGSDVSGLTADQRLAVTHYATSLLMRPDVAAESSYPGAAPSSSVRSKQGRTAEWYAQEARRILASYGRIR